jgi:membrane-associated phospholipid phosphatase
MRMSEWIQISFAAAFSLAAWLSVFTPRRLPLRRRWLVTGLAIILVAVLALAHLFARRLSPDRYLVLLDLLTVALFLIPYWQTGQFFLAPNPRAQDRLLAFDRWLLPRLSRKSGTDANSIGLLLEMAYLSCYPLVPLGLAAMYLAGLRSHIDGFWCVLLVSTYLCYAITPLVPAFPPRALLPDLLPDSLPAQAAGNPGKGRLLNRWILQHGSIHAISFPSAHVASAFAIALVLLHDAPWLGLVFLVIAILISLGAVVGRYHYALDVMAGAVTALIVFLACFRYL